ncbi:Uncharacterized protein APZ42_021518 [Daphnia magna]|uniref:Uncharacterized protein n=1 Tax=Daphnia magna TaxID=35525 RepID=A0A164WLG7_9CRUS|nr:Uncharacterized protein APZ42_021518 [Daphnia magna]
MGRSLRREGEGALRTRPARSPASTAIHPTRLRKREAQPVGEGLFIQLGEPVSPSVLPKWRTSSHHAHAARS